MERNIPTIRGNHDRWLTDRLADGLKRQDGFAFQETTADQRAWLYKLPDRYRRPSVRGQRQKMNGFEGHAPPEDARGEPGTELNTNLART